MRQAPRIGAAHRRRPAPRTCLYTVPARDSQAKNSCRVTSCTVTHTPPGTRVLPCIPSPQQRTVPSPRTAQLWYAPKLSCSGRGPDQPRASVRQQAGRCGPAHLHQRCAAGYAPLVLQRECGHGLSRGRCGEGAPAPPLRACADPSSAPSGLDGGHTCDAAQPAAATSAARVRRRGGS